MMHSLDFARNALLRELKNGAGGSFHQRAGKLAGMGVMKTTKAVFFLALMLASVLGFDVQAEIYYPWCANYSGGEGGGGGSNCGFSTYEQCMASVSGIGGFCDPNPFYTPPSQKRARHLHKKDKRMEISPSGGYSSGGYSSGGYSFWGTPGSPAD